MKNVLGKYPVTLTDMRARGGGGDVWRCFVRLYPPAYKSRSGRVQRWEREALFRRGESLFYLTGNKIAMMEPQILTPHTWRRRIRAFGSYVAMMDLLKLAMKTWHELPGGREIETLFERMFPQMLELEVTPLVEQPAKTKRRKAA